MGSFTYRLNGLWTFEILILYPEYECYLFLSIDRLLFLASITESMARMREEEIWREE